jgi:galactofuranosylgalactofuranosylrhamnosyl-N-acetylglucosaminyl-diphospho-decaprenol beta-1,5/1,6-galactofuranosyltransferase
MDQSETGTEQGFRVAQRVVFPADGDLDALPIYLDRDASKAATVLHPDDILGRYSAMVRSGERVSFGSYFNAFPASYWRRWTIVERVRLTVETSGAATVFIYKSNARGAAQRVDHLEVSGEASTTFDLPLTTFGDGGWYWFDLVAGRDEVTLRGAQWSVPDGGRERGRASLGVTTFNRPDYCARTIGMVAADPGLREVLDELLIVDQGTQKVREEPEYAVLAAELGDQLRVVDQENLGGSGGFSRCMYEVTTRGRSDYVILLDDDIILETESISRMTTFADMSRKPTIVGGHMFDMNNRSILHTFGEVVNPFYWQPMVPTPDQFLGHDFARYGLREASWMHQRVDVDYNGWWMCLIPTSVVRRLGLALPIFIKWDDTEYGLRAREAGIPTVSLPGAAVWHVSWIDKDDLVGWQAYFHARNRLITALMYSPFGRGASMLRTAFFLDLKHLVSMQYYTSEGRLLALQDVLSGPDKLHDILPRRLGEIRKLASSYPDGRVKSDIDAFPPIRRRKPIKTQRSTRPATVRALAVKGVLAVARQVLLPVDPAARVHPQERVAHKDNKWYKVARHDSAVVSTADGSGASWYIRDPKVMRSLTVRSSALHGEILSQWGSLRERYLAARTEITSFEAWEKTFGIDPADRE